MKTHVISLETHDDYISIRDKINWSKAPRVLLVWPNRGRVRLLMMDLKLILRQAEDIGAQIALVSDDPIVIEQSKMLGLPVFDSIPDAQKKPWRRPRYLRKKILKGVDKDVNTDFRDVKERIKTAPKKLSRPLQLIIFFTAIFSIAGLVGLFLPGAVVEVQQQPEIRQIQLSAWASPDIKSVSLSGGIPASQENIKIEGSKEGESSGTVRIPSRSATGSVVFRNLTNEPIVIPAGTVVRTLEPPVIRYTTSRDIRLSAGINSQATVTVTSLTAGIPGNVPAYAISAVEGEIGGNVVVENPEPISGGVETKAFAPTEADVERLRLELIEELSIAALEEFEQQFGDEAFFLPRQTLVLEEIIEEELFPEIGVPADQLRITLVAEFSIKMVSDQDVKVMAEQVFSTSLEPDESIVLGSLKYEEITEPELDQDDVLRWEMRLSQEIIRKLDLNQLQNDLTALQIDDAEEFLITSLNLETHPAIRVAPTFWNRMPFLSFRIAVVTDG